MACSVCSRRTAHFCWKCQRHLCNEPPKNQVDRNGKRFPKQFRVKVPKLDDNGSLQRDEKGNVVFRTEYGVLTCYLIDNQEQWKNCMNVNQNGTL